MRSSGEEGPGRVKAVGAGEGRAQEWSLTEYRKMMTVRGCTPILISAIESSSKMTKSDLLVACTLHIFYHDAHAYNSSIYNVTECMTVTAEYLEVMASLLSFDTVT